MAKRKRDATREAFWRKVLQRREKSGLTVVEFCRQEDLSATTYHYWRREIRRRDAEARPASPAPSPTQTLVPVQVVDDRKNTVPIEIVAGNGYVIRVSEAATTEHVRRVLQAVSELN